MAGALEAAIKSLIDQALTAALDPNAADEFKMVAQHGEQVDYQTAAKLLNRSRQTVVKWGQMGLLQDNGHGISVRSIARFLQLPPEQQKPPRKPKAYSGSFERMIP